MAAWSGDVDLAGGLLAALVTVKRSLRTARGVVTRLERQKWLTGWRVLLPQVAGSVPIFTFFAKNTHLYGGFSSKGVLFSEVKGRIGLKTGQMAG